MSHWSVRGLSLYLRIRSLQTSDFDVGPFKGLKVKLKMVTFSIKITSTNTENLSIVISHISVQELFMNWVN